MKMIRSNTIFINFKSKILIVKENGMCLFLLLHYKYIIVLIFYIYYINPQNPSFPNKKPFNKLSKGLLLSGSPYWTRSELFVE